MTIDIKNCYMNTPMDRFKYMRLKLADIPDDVNKQYNLADKVTPDGLVYLEVRKGIYWLPQAGMLSHKLLEKKLNEKGYVKSKITPGFWTHKWRPISFTLCVDGFGVNYVGKHHAEHLMQVLTEHDTISHDWTGAKYLGIDLDWDYEKGAVHTFMMGYAQNALTRFDPPPPKRLQHQP